MVEFVDSVHKASDGAVIWRALHLRAVLGELHSTVEDCVKLSDLITVTNFLEKTLNLLSRSGSEEIVFRNS